MTAQNIDCGEAVLASLSSIHNLCFGSKIRIIGKSLDTPVLPLKSGFKGFHCMDIFSR